MTRSISGCASRDLRWRRSTRSSRSSYRPSMTSSPAAASTSRTGRGRMPSGCSPKYKDRILCYNDDIQGTGSITVAGLFSALRVNGQQASRSARPLPRRRVGGDRHRRHHRVGHAAGRAQPRASARGKLSLFDVNGFVEASRSDLDASQQRYAQRLPPSRDFVKTIKTFKATAIIGVSTMGKAFNRPVIEAMTRLNERPIIFALSNPTDHAECTPEEAYRWSNGRAIYAAGVQFPPVVFEGKTYPPRSGQQLLRLSRRQPRRVRDAGQARDRRDVRRGGARHRRPGDRRAARPGNALPAPEQHARDEVRTAERVAKLAFDRNLAQVERPKDIRAWLRGMLYKPEYRRL